jgi:hypothetical protein
MLKFRLVYLHIKTPALPITAYLAVISFSTGWANGPNVFRSHALILRGWIDRGFVFICSKWNKSIWRLVAGRCQRNARDALSKPFYFPQLQLDPYKNNCPINESERVFRIARKAEISSPSSGCS